MATTIFPACTAFGRELIKRGISSRKLAEAIGYSVPAVKSWRASRGSAQAREPQRGALVLLTLHLGYAKSTDSAKTRQAAEQKLLRLIRKALD